MPELHMVTKMIQVASSSACKGCGLDCTKPDTASPCAADTCCDAYTCIQQYQTVTVLSGHTLIQYRIRCCTAFRSVIAPTLMSLQPV